MSSLPQPLGQPWVILLIYYIFGRYGRGAFRPLNMKKIKISHPIGLGLLLLGPMLLAGIASGMAAYQLGYASLKGVSQPDINPAKKFSNDRTNYGRNQTFIPVKEADVIKKVKVYIQQQEKKAKSGQSPKDSPKKDEKQSFLERSRISRG
ncbi:hypothetical protein V0288_03510 [Pannus brasiliensis CCIBt3594]|uniref:Uncharacterized protein n=2 Tax=Pannus TaxID=1427526 RepID=A0AAW9QS76_9CHRO